MNRKEEYLRLSTACDLIQAKLDVMEPSPVASTETHIAAAQHHLQRAKRELQAAALSQELSS